MNVLHFVSHPCCSRCQTSDCLLHAGRLFLKKLKDTLRIPVLALVDSDPYGLKILSVYMKGKPTQLLVQAALTQPTHSVMSSKPGAFCTKCRHCMHPTITRVSLSIVERIMLV